MSDKAERVARLIYFDDDGTGKTSVERIIAILREEYPEEPAQRQDIRWINAKPDAEYPVRILSAYLDEAMGWTDNTLGLPPENPLIIKMIEWQTERNKLLKSAIEKLSNPEPAQAEPKEDA